MPKKQQKPRYNNTKHPHQSSLNEAHKHLENVFQSTRFRSMEGLGNELPFFICPYNPSWEWGVQKSIKMLMQTLHKKNIETLNINIYELCVELLKKRGVWEKLLTREVKENKEDFLEIVQSLLNPERHITPAIQELIDTNPHDILLLSGIGQVYPYLRSHSIISNLQSKACKKPTVLFFPGSYTTGASGNASLDLFNIHQGDNYYRAFNIFHFEV
ncbi:MAG: DUF1788 domain-containing protein [Caldisericia bacterium]|nr:DUF1788 domain-containing protein [Caldisericia bacterium]